MAIPCTTRSPLECGATRPFVLGLVAGILMGALAVVFYREADPVAGDFRPQLDAASPSDKAAVGETPGVPSLTGAPSAGRAGTTVPARRMGLAPSASRGGASGETPDASLHHLRIELVTPEGKSSISGEVYVLPAGAKGVEDSDYLPSGQIRGVQPLDLAVPGPGPYDVHMRCGVNHAAKHDVLAGAENATVVRFEPKIGSIGVHPR